PNPSLDGVFVLGKGSLYFNNVPLGFPQPDMSAHGITDAHLDQLGQWLALQHPEHTDKIKRMINREFRWVTVQSSTGNLLLLFLFLTMAVSGLEGSILNPEAYTKNATWPGAKTGVPPVIAGGHKTAIIGC
ncbi:MAG: hypothetical protein M3P51_11610, partial [Chloroflexota bacterium]|nr:hypothetical protein [Chloroflexota bacterium]